MRRGPLTRQTAHHEDGKELHQAAGTRTAILDRADREGKFTLATLWWSTRCRVNAQKECFIRHVLELDYWVIGRHHLIILAQAHGHGHVRSF